VPGRAGRGLLESVLSNVDKTLEDRKRLADVVLMVALADSFASDAELERVAESIGSYAELEGVDFDYIYPRIEELQLTAPLFSEERENLVRDLTDARARRLALALAAKLVGETRELAEEERAMLVSLADAFKIPEAERVALFAPWKSTAAFGDEKNFVRGTFNAPERTEKRSFFEIMSSENEATFKILTHKVTAVRHLITKLFEGAEVLGLGEAIRVGPYTFHADAILEHQQTTSQEIGYQRYITRFLSAGEAMHDTEHSILTTLVQRLDVNAHVLVVHTGDLSAHDKIFLQSFEPSLLRGEHLEM
jgi:hypothetical protein